MGLRVVSASWRLQGPRLARGAQGWGGARGPGAWHVDPVQDMWPQSLTASGGGGPPGRKGPVWAYPGSRP